MNKCAFLRIFPLYILYKFYFMPILEGLKNNNHEAAPYVILGVILFTLLLYCMPMVYRFFKSQKNHTTMKPGKPKESNMVDHDRAFLEDNSPKA